jgi:hypothetical protein
MLLNAESAPPYQCGSHNRSRSGNQYEMGCCGGNSHVKSEVVVFVNSNSLVRVLGTEGGTGENSA